MNIAPSVVQMAAHNSDRLKSGKKTTEDHLSITHKLGSEDEAELDICEACETSPHDGVSRRRVFCACQVAPEPSEFVFAVSLTSWSRR
jgi:hypothetical protein